MSRVVYILHETTLRQLNCTLFAVAANGVSSWTGCGAVYILHRIPSMTLTIVLYNAREGLDSCCLLV